MYGLITLAMIIGLIWLEVVVFGLVGHKIGIVLTIIGVFVTAAIGIRLFRMSGASTLKRIADSVAQGRAPLLEVADGAAIMLAAFLLLIPGYATDALGFILFIPGLRTGIMVILLTLIRQIAPSMNHRAFKFSMNNMGQHENQHNPSSGAKNSFTENTSHQPTNNDPNNNDNEASNVTIEGDYKRRD